MSAEPATGGQIEPDVPFVAAVPLPPICDPATFPREDAAEARRIAEETLETVTGWAALVEVLDDADAVRRAVSVLAGLAAARDLDGRASLALLEAQRRTERACGRIVLAVEPTGRNAVLLLGHAATVCLALARLSEPTFERGIGVARAHGRLDVDAVLDAAQAGVEEEIATTRFVIEKLAGQGRPSQIVADELGLPLETVLEFGEKYAIGFPGDHPPPERPEDVGKYLDELVRDLAAIGQRAAVIDRIDIATVDTVRLREVVRGIWDGAAPAIVLRGAIERFLRE